MVSAITIDMSRSATAWVVNQPRPGSEKMLSTTTVPLTSAGSMVPSSVTIGDSPLRRTRFWITLEQGAALARQHGARLSVLRVMPEKEGLGSRMLSAGPGDNPRQALVAVHRALLEERVKPLREEELDVETKLCWGTPWIASTLALRHMKTSLWELTSDVKISDALNKYRAQMLPETVSGGPRRTNP